MTHEIILSGFGGQGIMAMGKMLAEAGMQEGLSVNWLPSYGPEVRGGTANCSVMLCMVRLSCWMPVTVLICAICEVIWALSIGFIGSWLLSCATSSFRKRSCAALGSVVELPFVEVVAAPASSALVSIGVMNMAYCPICRVLSSSVLAVFMTSTLFWYEREAEIMLTISSTAFTLEWLT